LIRNRKKPTRIAGIDFGLARIGIAISDETKIIASPFTTVTAEKKADRTVIKVANVLKNHQDTWGSVFEEIVLGLPLFLNGQSGSMADEVKQFAEKLKETFQVPIILWDERLSSVQADRALREHNLTRKERSHLIDQVSAAILLQSYLDYKNNSIVEN
jgi:putative Holliday junction resolvase